MITPVKNKAGGTAAGDTNKHQNNMRQKQIQQDILPILRTMRVKETKLWSLDRIRSLRSIIYTFSLQSGKAFKTKSNRKEQTISVTRIS